MSRTFRPETCNINRKQVAYKYILKIIYHAETNMATDLGENKEPCLLVFSSEYYLRQIETYKKQACILLQNAPQVRFISAMIYLCVLLLFCCVVVVAALLILWL